MVKGVCVKVSALRPNGYDNLEEWCKDPKHCLVTRRGRVFIGSGEHRRMFLYSASEWANPFKVTSPDNLQSSLEMYKTHLENKLSDPVVKARFLHLRDMDEIGCFCLPGAKCHRDIILELLETEK